MSTYIIINIKTMYHDIRKNRSTIFMDRYNDRHVFCNNTFFVVSRDKIIV